MTQYRWIVVSVLAVFVLSALCTPSDAQCDHYANDNCKKCVAQTDGGSGYCQWCTASHRDDDSQRLDFGFCEPQIICDLIIGRDALNGIGFRFKALTRLSGNDECTAIVNEVPPLLLDSCLNCVGDKERDDNTWCIATANGGQSGVCLGSIGSGATYTSSTVYCQNGFLKGEFDLSPTYAAANNVAACCSLYLNCADCTAAENICSWCALTEPSDTGGDPTSINVGVCVASTAENSCSSATFSTLTGFEVNSIPSGTPSCTATPSVHFKTEGTCATCLSDTVPDNSWCPLNNSGVATGGLCLTSAGSCTRAALGLSTGGDPLELTPVVDSADCCSLHDNCSGCAQADSGCSWCALTESVETGGDPTKLNVGVCVAGTADTICDSTTFGGLTDFVVNSIHSGTPSCTDTPSVHFNTEETCAACVGSGHSWCPLVKDTDPRGGLCSSTESCDKFTVTSGDGFTFQDAVTSPDKCPTDDEEKASTAFSMFSGSAVGFISAVAISGFVM